MDTDTKKREAGCTCQQEEGDSECVIHDPPTCKRCGCEYTMKWPDTEPTKYCNACAHAVVEAAETRAEKAEGERGQYRAALDKINVIRNSIVGLQRIGWSEHIYPLVAALDAAGIDGIGYGRAKPEFEGLLDRACKAEDAAKAATSELAEARAERAMFCALVESLTSERDEARAERDSLAETRGALTANLNALTIALGESRSELAEARRMLAECERERDAYRDGRYAGPWQPVADHHNGEGYSRAGAAFVGRRRDGRYEWNCAGFRSDLAETAAEAKAAADAHLVAAGWWLEQGK